MNVYSVKKRWSFDSPQFSVLPIEEEQVGPDLLVLPVRRLPLPGRVFRQEVAVVSADEFFGLEGPRGRDAPALGHAEFFFLKDTNASV